MSRDCLLRPTQPRLTRRKLLLGLGVGAAAAPLSACSVDTGSPAALSILQKAEALTKAVQRACSGPKRRWRRNFRLAHDLVLFQAERLHRPGGSRICRPRQGGFKDWKLEVGGLVRAAALQALARELRALPSRSQITRHDCVEGWSCIGQWKGIQSSVRYCRGPEAAGAL